MSATSAAASSTRAGSSLPASSALSAISDRSWPSRSCMSRAKRSRSSATASSASSARASRSAALRAQDAADQEPQRPGGEHGARDAPEQRALRIGQGERGRRDRGDAAHGERGVASGQPYRGGGGDVDEHEREAVDRREGEDHGDGQHRGQRDDAPAARSSRPGGTGRRRRCRPAPASTDCQTPGSEQAEVDGGKGRARGGPRSGRPTPTRASGGTRSVLLLSVVCVMGATLGAHPPGDQCRAS